MSAAVTTDEIYKRYLDKAIREILRLEHEVAEAAGGAPVAQPTGHPLGTIFLLKYGAQAHGAAGRRSLPRPRRPRAQEVARAAHVDPVEVFGTNCVKFAGADEEACRAWLRRELRIVQPRLVVVMGEDALEFLDRASSSRSPARSRLPWASSSSSPRRSKPWSSPTSTSHSTTRRRRHAFGTRSSPSAPGGPSCRLTDPLRRARRVVRGGAATGTAVAVAGRRARRRVLDARALRARLARAARSAQQPDAAGRGRRAGRRRASLLRALHLHGARRTSPSSPR